MTLHGHSYVQCNIVIFDVAYSLMNTEVALCYFYVNKNKVNNNNNNNNNNNSNNNNNLNKNVY